MRRRLPEDRLHLVNRPSLEPDRRRRIILIRRVQANNDLLAFTGDRRIWAINPPFGSECNHVARLSRAHNQEIVTY
jgi:hypothetical protein